jgi:hypothetical protein
MTTTLRVRANAGGQPEAADLAPDAADPDDPPDGSVLRLHQRVPPPPPRPQLRLGIVPPSNSYKRVRPIESILSRPCTQCHTARNVVSLLAAGGLVGH